MYKRLQSNALMCHRAQRDIRLQGRRQEFFDGRALGGFREGLPSHFAIFMGWGSSPIFGRFNGQNEKNFTARGGMPNLPMPAYALVRLVSNIKISNAWRSNISKYWTARTIAWRQKRTLMYSHEHIDSFLGYILGLCIWCVISQSISLYPHSYIVFGWRRQLQISLLRRLKLSVKIAPLTSRI